MAGPRAIVRGLIIEPINVQSSSRRLPIPPTNDEARWLFLLVLFAVGLLVVIWFTQRRRDRASTETAAMGVLAAFSAGLLPQMIQRAEIIHVLYIGCVVGAMLPVVAAMALRSQGRAIAAVAAVLTASAVGLLVLRAVETNIGVGVIPSHELMHRGRTFRALSEGDAEALQAVLADVDASVPTGARLFVGPRDLRRTNYNETFLYFLLPHLEPATYFREMNPGALDRRGTRFVDDLAAADVLILSDVYDLWNEPNDSSDYGDERANDIVRRSFCEVSRHSHWTVLRRCDQGASTSSFSIEAQAAPAQS